MPEILPYKLLSFSSEDELYPAKNLLKGSSSYQWKCKSSSEKYASIEFEFNTPTQFTRIEMGNSSSAFIEIQVSRFPDNKDFQVLLGSTSLMTPTEAIKCEGLSRVKYFKETNFSKSISREKWDILKVICTQPFNKTLQYGLSFIKFYGNIHSDTSMNDDQIACDDSKIDITKLISMQTAEQEVWRPGCLFANKIKSDGPPVNVTEKIRVAKSLSEHQHVNIPSTSYSHPISNESSENEVNSNPPSLPENSLKRKHTANVNDDFSLKKTTGDQLARNEFSNIKKIKIDHAGSSETVSKNSIGQFKSQTNNRCEKRKIDEISQKPSSSSPQIIADSQINHNLPSSSSSFSNVTQHDASDNVLENVVFVLSGYKNPLRNSLRDKAISLGAKYRSSWTDDSTHLICAFHNTPKFKEVSGKGIIVTEKWIIDCHSRKKHLAWRDYRVKGAPSPNKSSNKNLNKVAHSSIGSTKPVFVNNGSTDLGHAQISNEVRSNDKAEPSASGDIDRLQQIIIDSLPVLPTPFCDLHFFFYGSFDSGELRFLKRLIQSFGGILHEYMALSVSIVITDCSWDSNFDQALGSNPGLKFIKSSWLRRCDEAGCLVSLDEFEIKKSSF